MSFPSKYIKPTWPSTPLKTIFDTGTVIQATQIAMRLLKEFEGEKKDSEGNHIAYPATAEERAKGIWTIGYGYTYNVKEGDKITQEEAESLFITSVAKEYGRVVFERVINKLVNPNQLAAMISLTYNIGEGGFRGSTVLKAVNAGDFEKAAKAFMMWATPSILKPRREKEVALFKTPWGSAPLALRNTAPSSNISSSGGRSYNVANVSSGSPGISVRGASSVVDNIANKLSTPLAKVSQGVNTVRSIAGHKTLGIPSVYLGLGVFFLLAAGMVVIGAKASRKKKRRK
jgi:GH24 family phage-related lysozyme (muramidase)